MTHDVVIAGGGPNGLMLATELSLAGVRPLVLETLPRRAGDQRANGLAGQVVRMMDRRGLYRRLAGGIEPPVPTPRYMFGALGLDLSLLPDNPMYTLPVAQPQVERVLEERATELGVEIRRGHALAGLSQRPDAVDIDVDGPDGRYRLAARFLIGADGGHSAVRKLSGIGFPGVYRDDSVTRFVQVSLPDGLHDPATNGLRLPGRGLVPGFLHQRTEHGLFVYAPFPGRPPALVTTEWGDIPADDEPLTSDEMRASLRRVLGEDIPFGPPEGEGPHRIQRIVGGNTRLADRYRDGRVLLIGDAAHVHSAISGSGLNLGLQDAVNLGWKLAAEVRGDAPAGLLDTYQSERRPVAERVVLSTQAQAALIAPGPEVTALRTLMSELLTEPVVTGRLADLLSGAEIRYPAAPDAHPLAGRWAPDLTLSTDSGPVRLADLTATGRPLLLDLTGGTLADEVAGHTDRVDVVAARADTEGAPTALLLRPDCYLAWASSSPAPDADERAALREALSRWFGAARQPVG